MAIDPNEYPNIVRKNLKANNDFTKFFYLFKINGKQYKGIIDLSDKQWGKRERIAYAEKKMLDDRDQLEGRVQIGSTVNHIVDLYLMTIPDGKYKNNRKSYYDTYVKAKIGNKKASEILPAHLQKVVNDLIASGQKARTAKQAIEILSPSFKIAKANKIVSHNPCEDVVIKLPKTKKIVSDATQRLKLLYDTIIELYSDDPFYRAFFLLALQGRRRGEIMDLQAEDVVLDHDYYILRNTKNGEEQKIFLPPNVKEALIEFMPDKGYVFASRITGGRLNDIRRQIEKIRKKTGEWFTLHYTRNVMVSAMAEQGVDAIYMSGALGHNDPTTITKYLTMNYLQGSRIASNMITHAIAK